MPDSQSDIIYKRAETYEEIEQALRIVYGAYKERGITQDNASRLRLTKFHALPTTAVLIAVKNNEVIATMSLVLDSSLGLPLEDLRNVDDLRSTTRRMAEISSLAIKRGYRSQRGKLLLPLCNFMYRYAKNYLGVEILFAAVHPLVQDFYRCIMLFKPVDNYKVHEYASAQGALAVIQYLRIDGEAESDWQHIYNGKSNRHNFYKYFVLDAAPVEFHFPKDNYFKAGQITLSPGHLEYLFRHCSGVFNQLNDKERAALSNIYFLKEYRSVIGIGSPLSGNIDRVHPRFAVMLHCRMRNTHRNEIFPGTCLEVSRKGLSVHIHKKFSVSTKDSIHIAAQLGPDLSANITGRVMWVSLAKGQLGIELETSENLNWTKFIDSLEAELQLASQANDKQTPQNKKVG